jgi:hypothetical protein
VPLKLYHNVTNAPKLALAKLVTLALVSCSPYPYSDSSAALSAKIDTLGTSYQTTAQKIHAEQHVALHWEWLNTRPSLTFGLGCEPGGNKAISCDVIKTSDMVEEQVTAAAPPQKTSSALAQSAKPAEAVCQTATEASATPTKQTVAQLTPLQRAGVLDSLKNYTAALTAITKAQDRTDFDSAAGKVSAAVGALVQSAAAASGEGAAAAPAVGAVAKASTDVLLWAVGQSLDWQRWRELQRATATACEPVHSLAIAVQFMLEEQRDVELRTLREQLTLYIQAANRLRVFKTNDQAYGDAIDRAFTAADNYQAVRATDPQGVGQSLQQAHDKLVIAVRNDTGQSDALVTSLTTLAKNIDQLEMAAQTTTAPASSPAKKS